MRIEQSFPNIALMPLEAFLVNIANVDYYVAPTNFPLNIWVFVGLTYGDGVFKVYIDGEKLTEVTQTFTASNDNNPIWIGQKNFGYGSIRGFLNNTYLFDSTLSEQQMTRLYEMSF